MHRRSNRALGLESRRLTITVSPADWTRMERDGWQKGVHMYDRINALVADYAYSLKERDDEAFFSRAHAVIQGPEFDPR